MSQTTADAVKRRLVSIAVKTIELAGHLPKTSDWRHVSGQILRSGTSPAFASLRPASRRFKVGLPAEAKAGIWLLKPKPPEPINRK